MEIDSRPDEEHFGEASLTTSDPLATGLEDADFFLGWGGEGQE